MTDQEQIAGLACANAELGLLVVELRHENDVLRLRLAGHRGPATIEAEPPADLLDRITPAEGCPHLRVSARPDEHGRAILAVCLDCGAELCT